MTAIFKNEGARVKITPTANLGSGTVVQKGKVVGVATSAIAANTSGYIQIAGEYDVSVFGVTAEAGAVVTVAGKNLSGSDIDLKFGYAVEAITSSQTVARLLLDPYINGNTDTDTNTCSLTPMPSPGAFTLSGSGTASATLAASTAVAPTAEDFDNLSTSLATQFNLLLEKLVAAGVLTT